MAAIRSSNPGRLRTILVTLGTAAFIAGIALIIAGSNNSAVEEVDLLNSCSAGAWSEILGYESTEGSTEEYECEEAKGAVSRSQTQTTVGSILAVIGAATALAAAIVRKAQPSAAPATGERPPLAISRRPCPECGESIPVAARRCRFCNHVPQDPAEPAAQEALARCPTCGKQVVSSRMSKHIAVTHDGEKPKRTATKVASAEDILTSAADNVETGTCVVCEALLPISEMGSIPRHAGSSAASCGGSYKAPKELIGRTTRVRTSGQRGKPRAGAE